MKEQRVIKQRIKIHIEMPMIGKPMTGKYWAYFSPDGYLQVRSIAKTRALCREVISKFEYFTWQDYEARGYFLRKVDVSIKEIGI